MGFETRGARLYYYRKELRNGRVQSVYSGKIGSDQAQLMFSLAYLEKQERQQARKAAQAEAVTVEGPGA